MSRSIVVMAFLLSLTIVASAQIIQVDIEFEDLPVGTVVTGQYPNAVFSCELGYEPRVTDGIGNSCSPPNGVVPGIIGGATDYRKPLFVDFLFPVNDLTICVDHLLTNAGGIIRVFESGSFSEEFSYGCLTDGCVLDLTDFHEVTRIEMIPVVLGAKWDDFSFTYMDTSPIATLNEMGIGVFAVLVAAVGVAFLWRRKA